MRYFIEVGYKGTAYAGFQVQLNAPTIQGELEKVLEIILRLPIQLTGSSRTDAGVHARQNFFHFDINATLSSSLIYNINALLPADIVVKSLFAVGDTVHSRFSASTREYSYYITKTKNPFTYDTAWFYPYTVDFQLLS